jgi:AbrB family looped-hinge helix DNA binding protein
MSKECKDWQKKRLRFKVARRYQITIPERVRDNMGRNIGDTVDVTSQDGKVTIEKIGRNGKL